jgi:hypothetical protein
MSHTTISTRKEYVSTGTYENLSSGDVNPGSVLARHDLLQDKPYRKVWIVFSIMRLTMTLHLGRGDLGIPHGPLPWEVNMFS